MATSAPPKPSLTPLLAQEPQTAPLEALIEEARRRQRRRRLGLETQTIRFARDQRDTRATFSGHVIGGSGRYAHVHGSVSGGGPGVGSRGEWTVSLQLSYR